MLNTQVLAFDIPILFVLEANYLQWPQGWFANPCSLWYRMVVISLYSLVSNERGRELELTGWGLDKRLKTNKRGSWEIFVVK